MRTRIVPIGNSQGIRIPKALLGNLALGTEVELGTKGDTLIIQPVRKARDGWAKAARAMNAAGNDALLDPDGTGRSEFDLREWTWSGRGRSKRSAV